MKTEVRKIKGLSGGSSDPEPQKTGDTNNIFLYSDLTIVSLAALIALLFVSKRKKQEENT